MRIWDIFVEARRSFGNVAIFSSMGLKAFSLSLFRPLPCPLIIPPLALLPLLRVFLGPFSDFRAFRCPCLAVAAAAAAAVSSPFSSSHFPVLLPTLRFSSRCSPQQFPSPSNLSTRHSSCSRQHKASSLFLRLVASRRFFFLFRFSAFVLFRERWYATRHFYRFLDFDADFFRICLDYLAQIRSTLL